MTSLEQQQLVVALEKVLNDESLSSIDKNSIKLFLQKSSKEFTAQDLINFTIKFFELLPLLQKYLE